jgi:hypothetical protein
METKNLSDNLIKKPKNWVSQFAHWTKNGVKNVLGGVTDRAVPWGIKGLVYGALGGAALATVTSAPILAAATGTGIAVAKILATVGIGIGGAEGLMNEKFFNKKI